MLLRSCKYCTFRLQDHFFLYLCAWMHTVSWGRRICSKAKELYTNIFIRPKHCSSTNMPLTWCMRDDTAATTIRSHSSKSYLSRSWCEHVKLPILSQSIDPPRPVISTLIGRTKDTFTSLILSHTEYREVGQMLLQGLLVDVLLFYRTQAYVFKLLESYTWLPRAVWWSGLRSTKAYATINVLIFQVSQDSLFLPLRSQKMYK